MKKYLSLFILLCMSFSILAKDKKKLDAYTPPKFTNPSTATSNDITIKKSRWKSKFKIEENKTKKRQYASDQDLADDEQEENNKFYQYKPQRLDNPNNTRGPSSKNFDNPNEGKPQKWNFEPAVED